MRVFDAFVMPDLFEFTILSRISFVVVTLQQFMNITVLTVAQTIILPLQ
jgi:hypothetical protein